MINPSASAFKFKSWCVPHKISFTGTFQFLEHRFWRTLILAEWVKLYLPFLWQWNTFCAAVLNNNYPDAQMPRSHLLPMEAWSYAYMIIFYMHVYFQFIVLHFVSLCKFLLWTCMLQGCICWVRCSIHHSKPATCFCNPCLCRECELGAEENNPYQLLQC